MNWKKITLKKIKNRVTSEVANTRHSVTRNTSNLIEPNYKKILHIWDNAGVASLLSRELNKTDYTSHVIMRREHDKFGMTEYYGQEASDLEGNPFLSYSIRKAEGYGIIHLHSVYEAIPKLKKLYPKKKIILQFHGADIMQPKDGNLIEYSNQADAIICSTPDLKEQVADINLIPPVYVCENAIDTELFKPLDTQKTNEKALFFEMRYLDSDRMKAYLEKNCPWKIEVIDRELEIIKFKDMPKFYNKYNKFVDIKIPFGDDYKNADGVIQAWSKSGLEALACGLWVYNYEGDVVKGLPEKFTPEHQCETMMAIYNKITK